MTQQNCQSKYENCYYDNVEQSWIPVVSGFLLSRVIRKDRDEPFVYNSGGILICFPPRLAQHFR
ncbi:putative membrane protein YjfM [Escherichia coli]|uniref:Putative membrane protein YjfM n=1 Tax=Escherichia coli TaxID=562 RepID=A0A376TMG9_ECOLX|nr:putative membrane protein YjfM [Escherichia coli]